MRLWIIYVTGDFNWLVCELKTKVIKHLRHQKNVFFVFVCMYKMDTFALFTAKAWIKNGVEVIEYRGEIWINQEHLQEKLVLSNIYGKTQYYPDECKK